VSSIGAQERPALLGAVRGLLEDAQRVYAGRAPEGRLAEERVRLDEPLRVAIAGRVKAGKSTLLNALVGELLAPTDEGECTRIVTWYHDGVTYRVTLVPREGDARQVPFQRDDEAVVVDIGGAAPESVERLDVEWPSASLREITLIDTPGIGALSTASESTTDFLTPGEDRETPADAVLYLMKHLHTTDVDFLAAFHDEEVSQATPVNAIAVLSRADEVGAGRIDSLESAARIAARYAADPKVRRLVQTVVPVSGLLAETGATLRESDYRSLAAIAAAPADDVERLLISADRFINADLHLGVTDLERAELLDRFGLFGVRLALSLIREGTVTNANTLVHELEARSGLPRLRTVLLSQFAERRDLLKARAGLVAVETAARTDPIPESSALLAEVERVVSGAHELEELRLLNLMRAGTVELKPADAAIAERLLGGSGPSAAARLGLAADADDAEVRAAATEQLMKWQKRAESPLAGPEVADAARALMRSCEALLT
jgi:50S ribosome-binding GTPase